MNLVRIVPIVLLFAFTADQPAYRLFDQRGKTTSYKKLLNQAAQADVVLFGELHNNPICHWLQHQLTRDLLALRHQQLSLGAEMFETDNQPALTAYVTSQTTDEIFGKQARRWPNYQTDYRPVVELARQHNIPFVATNVPRRYASLVARNGLAALDTLPQSIKSQFATLPLTVDLALPGYANMLTMMNSPAHSPQGGATSEMAANFARAQALKDATMAQFILKNWSPGRTFLHLNGAYHSNNFEGIVWYLKKNQPTLKIVTISSVEAESVEKLVGENRGLANFTIAIPANMTKTY